METPDRCERARLLGWGDKSRVYDSCLVLGDVQVGEDCWIGPFTVLDGSGNLEIGNACSISAGVQIYTHDMGPWQSMGGIERSPVRIGNHVFIGPNAVICKGVTIGDNAMIGALSLVREDVPAGAKAWGRPAKVRNA